METLETPLDPQRQKDIVEQTGLIMWLLNLSGKWDVKEWLRVFFICSSPQASLAGSRISLVEPEEIQEEYGDHSKGLHTHTCKHARTHARMHARTHTHTPCQTSCLAPCVLCLLLPLQECLVRLVSSPPNLKTVFHLQISHQTYP